jgi:hypothetical protein
MGISNAVFEYVTSLQYKVKSLASRVQSFESGEKYGRCVQSSNASL